MKSWYPNAYIAVVVLAAVCAAMQPGHASMAEQEASAWWMDSLADSEPSSATDRATNNTPEQSPPGD